MYRLHNVWLCIIVSVLQIQSIFRSTTIDAYGIPKTTKESFHRRRVTFLSAAKLVKNPSPIDATTITTSLLPNSRPKRKNKSESPLIDIENSTSTAPIFAPVANTKATPTAKNRKAQKVDAISQTSANNFDCNSSATVKIALPVECTTPSPTHWIVDTDKVLFQEISVPVVDAMNASSSTATNDEMNATSINTTTIIPSVFHCTIRGNPLPLRRHRTRLGFIYNPSAATQLTFRTLVLQIIDSLPNHRNHTATSSVGIGYHSKIPLWNIEQPIAVSIVFRMKRPNSHFIANKPFIEATAKKKTTATSRLRHSAPKVMCTTSMRTDIDNLAKFVLDSLNNVTYVDDRQIVSLHVIKLFDNDISNRYQGSTTITIRLLRDDDMTTHLLEQKQQMLSATTESVAHNNNMF
jgi:Holliday junction resolvase RusA-like endonuclease